MKFPSAHYDRITGKTRSQRDPMKLTNLYDAMSDAYNDDPNLYRDAHVKLFEEHFDKAIQNEGFTPQQAGVISFAAYERGHSHGHQEIVSVAMGICAFAKELLAAD